MPDGVTNADAVLLTHDHVDNTDLGTVLPIAVRSPYPRFAAPFTCLKILSGAGLETERVVVPVVGEPFEAVGARVTAVPSAHTEMDRDPERGYPYLG
jgi:L-ascorbate metabolism protein UlaG (beta-lactamase superfamily)